MSEETGQVAHNGMTTHTCTHTDCYSTSICNICKFTSASLFELSVSAQAPMWPAVFAPLSLSNKFGQLT